MVPLAQPYDPPLPKRRRKAAGEEEDVVEDIPVAMFLVEFSLDSSRTVLINHSLAERFWEWKRLKMLARTERAAQRQRAKDYIKHRRELEEKRKKEEEELHRQENATPAVNTQDPPAVTEIPATTDLTLNATTTASEQPWPAPNSTWPANEAATDPYYNYSYYPSAPANATETWTGYEGYSASYSTGYDYGYNSATALEISPTMAGGTAGLVDSSSYYGNGGYAGGGGSNESGASNWYGTEYSAYDMSGYSSAATDYGNSAGAASNGGWVANPGYDGSTYYDETQASVDPNAAWNANDGDYNYAYNGAEQWGQEGYAQDQYQGYDSYANAADLPSGAATKTDGYYYNPDASSGDYTAPQPAVAAQWEEVFDPATQQTYYVNRVTNETAWQLPS
ncbi:uncharacterized protein IUM83_12281 [Phytophthora cinnamomi]|uniref:uncharacterized protein n=1 Tax=Phytophthora cinnamomi TaxID=4785 RepID=UPI00355A315F|nr:hypothetical protein IUM83_12281 [Phytophthora cinnamomi]